MKKNHDKKGFFILGGPGTPGTHPHDILWAVHDGKTMVEVRARKISVSSQLRWVVGAERCVFLSYKYARGCDALGSN